LEAIDPKKILFYKFIVFLVSKILKFFYRGLPYLKFFPSTESFYPIVPRTGDAVGRRCRVPQLLPSCFVINNIFASELLAIVSPIPQTKNLRLNWDREKGAKEWVKAGRRTERKC